MSSASSADPLERVEIRKRSYPSDDPTKQTQLSFENKLTAILHKCEKMYYTNLLEKHKSNLRETWKIIKELLHRQGSNRTSSH